MRGEQFDHTPGRIVAEEAPMVLGRLDGHSSTARKKCLFIRRECRLDVAGMIAGYTTLGLNRARALPQEGEIYEIYMRPEYQGIGLGYTLFGEARRLLKSLGCKGMAVWCLEDSHHAVDFFRSNGGIDAVEGMEDFDDVQLKKLGFIWN